MPISVPSVPSRPRAIRAAALGVVTCALVFAFSAPAVAEPLACKRGLAASLAKFVQGKTKLLQKCDAAVVAGKRPGPCPDVATSAKIVRLTGKLRRVVSQRCGLDGNCGIGDDDDLTAIGWNAGSCPNLENGACTGAIASCNDVVDCLACVGEAAVDRAVDLAYDDLVPSVPGTNLNRCQSEIGKSAGRYLQAKTLALAKCEAKVLGGALAGRCPDAAKTQPKLVRAAGKVGSAICRACGGADRDPDADADRHPQLRRRRDRIARDLRAGNPVRCARPRYVHRVYGLPLSRIGPRTRAARFCFAFLAVADGRMVRAELDARAGGPFTFTDRRGNQDVEPRGTHLEVDRRRRHRPRGPAEGHRASDVA